MDLTIVFSKDKLCVAFQSLGESRLKHSVFTWQLLTCWKSELLLKRKQVGIKIIAHFQVEPTRSVRFLSQPFLVFSAVIVKLDELSSVFLQLQHGYTVIPTLERSFRSAETHLLGGMTSVITVLNFKLTLVVFSGPVSAAAPRVPAETV